MATSSSLTLTVLVTLLVMAVSISTAQAQAQTCAAKLIPCAQYLNATTTPPKSCCDPIKEAVANDLQCLCNLFENPSFLAGIGINVDQALGLSRSCGISSDTIACNTAPAPAPDGSSTQAPAPAQAPGGSSTQLPPGSTPGGNNAGSTPGGNNAGKMASSGVVGLLLISTYMMLF